MWWQEELRRYKEFHAAPKVCFVGGQLRQNSGCFLQALDNAGVVIDLVEHHERAKLIKRYQQQLRKIMVDATSEQEGKILSVMLIASLPTRDAELN